MEQNIKSLSQHIHNFLPNGNYLVCSCGKKILKLTEVGDRKKGIRSDGRPYTKKDNVNRFFYPDEYMKFEDSLKDKQKHSVKCLINTGARIDELQHVQVRDFVYNPDGRSRIILRKTKTKRRKGEFGSGKPRDIPLSKPFAKYLFNYIKENKLTEESRLNILSNAALKIAYGKAAKKAGIRDYWNISSHTFRKTLEVWLMALGVDSLPLVAHLGHDLRTAASHYVSPDVFSWEDKRKIRQIIGDLYER